MSKHSKPFYVFSGIAGFLATAAVFSTLAWLLWNALLPGLFGLPVLSWLQTLGIFVLCRVLFGGMTSGFRGGTFDRGGRKRENLFRDRWDAMSEEERQHLAEKIKRHHGFDPRGGCEGRCGFGAWDKSGAGNETGTQEKADTKKDDAD
ncbi:MAG: hypothetical protein LBN21_08040 [Treponema sp.]|nr:hypothetical protein [Treponema sp.]